ncbi:hypothetical protein SAMN02745751_03278 [Dethiosulfatibacter aminovorans DSM 17477]|uniref:Uncharacterized protein n=1 Tax=Dethiosulfatibacter aminovorans DSM 17477 TaxID=1121476 RepID=A0A1M6LUC0_9FIRM|nr:hypothetical protein [Dethiosulfatibacter aminovorans]SHJ74740.1 hypothetical protein SAMN02745751_03278 [Dethiosulfatibacter aminovorans DSM 17477]
MIGVLKKAIRIKSVFPSQLLVFLAIFIALLGESIGVFYLAVLNRMLPVFAAPVFQIIGYMVGGFFLYYGIHKIQTPKIPDEVAMDEETEPDSVGHEEIHEPGKKKGLAAFVMNFLILAVIAKLLQHNIPVLANPDATPIFLKSLALTIAGLILMEIIIFNSWLIVRNSTSPNQYFSCFMKSIAIYVKSIKYNIMSSIIIILISVFILLLHFLFWPVAFSTNLSPVTILFYRTVTYACLMGWGILFLMKTIRVIYEDKADFKPAKTSPLGYVLVVLSLAALVYYSIPFTNSIEGEYDRIIAGAEDYRRDGQLYLCGNEYKKAYALMKAYNGYLMDMHIQKDKKATDDQKKNSMKEANALFKEAYAFYPNGGKIYYLDALRYIDEDPSKSLSLAQNAKEYDPLFVEAYKLILDLSIKLNKEELVESIAREMVVKGMYSNSIGLNSMSVRRIDSTLESIDGYMKICLENITTMAYEYYNNQLYPEAMEELMMIREILPEDVVTNYLIAMTDLELKADNKAYTTAIEAAQTILDQYPDEKWAQELYSGVILRAGNQNVMDKVIKEAYERNPQNPEIAEQYAYSLLKKNYNSSYYEVTQEAELVVDKILAKDSKRWFAVYCKSLIELYKGEYKSSLDNIDHFSDLIVEKEDLFSFYDELYNTYVIKYARRMVMDEKAKEVLSSGDSADAFTCHYIMGAFGTMSSEVDTLGTIDNLTLAIEYNPSFSKLYYMIGNAYMEYGYHQNHPESYVLAENYYKESIRIFNNDPYAWFALGHAYKKQERYEEAMGAFQKTLTLMPAQDHQSDHFGVSIHSTYQIRELENILASKEGQ